MQGLRLFLCVLFGLGFALLTGCGGGKESNTFQVVSIDPKDSIHVPTDAKVRAVFNRDIDEKSVNKLTFRVVRDYANEPVKGTLKVIPGTKTVEFTPAERLLDDELYIVRINHKITDKAGNHLAESKEWEFSTMGEAAQLLSFDPPNNDTGVSVKSAIHVQFTRDINPATVTPESFFVHTVNGNRVTGDISVQGNDLIFKPSPELLLNTQYTANLTLAVQDLHGQSALTTAQQWQFTTTSIRTSTTLVGGSEEDAILDAAIDKLGNIYVVGFSASKIGDQTPIASPQTGRGPPMQDVMVAKYNATGTREWIRLFGTPQPDTGTDIALAEDATGVSAIYVVGNTDGNIGDNANGTDSDVFIAKLSPAGIVEWKKQRVATGHDFVSGVVTQTSTGAIYLAVSSDTGTMSNGPQPTPMLPPIMPSHQIFLVQYDSLGNLVKEQKNTSAFDDSANDLIMGSDNKLYITGTRQDLNALRPDMPSLNGEAYVGSFDTTTLTETSNITFGTPSFDTAFGSALDAQGNIYIVGVTNGDLVGGNTGLTVADDAFIAKYTLQGIKLWVKQWGEQNNPDRAVSPVIDAAGNPVLLSSSMLFDIGVPPPPFTTSPPIFKSLSTSEKLHARMGHDYFGPKSSLSVYRFNSVDGALVGQPNRIRTAGHADSNRMLQDTAGNLIVAGNTHGEIEGNAPLGNGDGFLLKINAIGVTQ